MLPMALCIISFFVCIPAMLVSYYTGRSLLLAFIAIIGMLVSGVLVYTVSEIFVYPFAVLAIVLVLYIILKYTWQLVGLFMLALLIGFVLIVACFIIYKSNCSAMVVDEQQVISDVYVDTSETTNYGKVEYQGAPDKKTPLFRFLYKGEKGTLDYISIREEKTCLHFIDESEGSYLVQTTTEKYYWDNNKEPSVKKVVSNTVVYDLYIPRSALINYPG